MQFSRGSIKALGAISGCLNKGIVARREALRHPISVPSAPSPAACPSRSDFTCEFNLPFFRPIPETSVKGVAFQAAPTGLSDRAASGFIKSIVLSRGGGSSRVKPPKRVGGGSDAEGRSRNALPLHLSRFLCLLQR